MSDFTGRREPETKERMQGILDFASFGAVGVLARFVSCFLSYLGMEERGNGK
jgi:hypothetical protein